MENAFHYKYANGIKKWLYRYSILRQGKFVENNIIGWKTALAHAKKWKTNLFDERPQKVEILNIWTGEIITVEEAENRVKKCVKRSQ